MTFNCLKKTSLVLQFYTHTQHLDILKKLQKYSMSSQFVQKTTCFSSSRLGQNKCNICHFCIEAAVKRENERGLGKIKMINVANCSKLWTQASSSSWAEKVGQYILIYYIQYTIYIYLLPTPSFPQKIIINKLATVCSATRNIGLAKLAFSNIKMM